MRKKELSIRIVLLEDDFLQSEYTVNHLLETFGGTVEVLNTESQFVSQLSRIADDPPDVFVIDLNLPWADPHPTMPLPPQRVLGEGIAPAGFRCCELLSAHNRTRRVPIVLYSIVDKSHYERQLRDLAEWVTYIPKDNLPLLCETIRRLITTFASQRELES